MGSAIILNGKCVQKVSQWDSDKYEKNPNIKLLELCKKSELNSKLSKWKELLKEKDEIDTSIKKYHFKNKVTGETIVSIYDNLDNLQDIINTEGYDI